MTDLREAIKTLAGGSEADRIYAAADIGNCDWAGGTMPLLERLELEPSRAVREAIFTALRRRGGREVIEGTVPLLDHPDAFLRNHAVELLQTQGAPAVPYLESAFATGDRDRRKLILDVLAVIDAVGVPAIYRRALSDPEINVVITAVETLGYARRREFRELVEGLLTPGCHPMLAGACLETLARIGDSYSLEVVRRWLGNPLAISEVLRPSYLTLVGALGGAADAAAVVALMNPREADADVVGALTALRGRIPGLRLPSELRDPLERAAMNHSTPWAAYEAMRLLGALERPEESRLFLEQCLKHNEKSIRLGAVQVLLETRLETAATLQLRLAGEADEELWHLLRL